MRKVTAAVVALLVAASAASADPARVRFSEGLVHGFLALRTTDGATVADGDLIQSARAGRVTTRLVFRFRDGSVRDVRPGAGRAAEAVDGGVHAQAAAGEARDQPRGEHAFTLNGSTRHATHYVVKIDVGGFARLVAPLVGKRPTRTSGFYPATRRPS